MDSELKNSILKSGTTILGIVCKDGVVMAADRQSSAGTIVMNKDSEKIVFPIIFKTNKHKLKNLSKNTK